MSRINDYHGEKVVVIGSLVRKPGDVLVTTQLAGGREAPTNLVWRVLNDGNGGRLSTFRYRAYGWPSPSSRISFPPSTMQWRQGRRADCPVDCKDGGTGKILRSGIEKNYRDRTNACGQVGPKRSWALWCWPLPR
jgi:phospholipid transport system substrate-binding protein